MNILSAIFAGQTGFLKASESFAKRAASISNGFTEVNADEKIVENLVGMELDKTSAKANLRTISVSGEILGELVKNTTRR